ncbi:ATP-dependent RNA helicase Dhx29 [Ananas comosus]|uniref:ATP-dependent RNA helicase Dhx29 n=1 Tax=Ananas comosus TaxID=4615 RepID=A0A199UIM6_ANACO|nr:ATP-dependent RNA helicase Dhx29 [Ananas comosus]
MAPKKKPQQQQRSKAKGKPYPADARTPAPKLQISAENERRLRRLLMNTDLPPATAAAAAAPPPPSSFAASSADAAATESRTAKAKRLRSVYDNLSLEGFSSDQIERALSALHESATFESALDWLCFNLPGNELPLKFSTGASSSSHGGSLFINHDDKYSDPITQTEGSVKIIATAREDWVAPQHQQEEEKDGMDGMSVKVKGKRDEASLDDGKSSQAEWIRQYMEQEEEEEDTSNRAASLAEEYRVAMLGSMEAKQKGNKKSQKRFDNTIHKLKQELAMLGLSEEILCSGLQEESVYSKMGEVTTCDSTPHESFTTKKVLDEDSRLGLVASESELHLDESRNDSSILRKTEGAVDRVESLHSPVNATCVTKEESEELELDNLFSEDSSSSGVLLKQQKTEKVPHSKYVHALGNLDEIWKKGESGRIPKAVLQKLCQRLGWEAPKYSKLSEKDNKFVYAVSILRGASGRGKSRKAGGFTTMQLPDHDETFESIEVSSLSNDPVVIDKETMDAQNRVAAFALYQFFPELPLNQMLVEPYSSLVLKWQKDECSSELDNEDIRRDGFVDMILNTDASGSATSFGARNPADSEKLGNSYDAGDNPPPEKIIIVKSSTDAGRISPEQAESVLLKNDLANKKKLPKYMKMLEARAALPIANLKNHILHSLNENDVIVVCGETGCGKTTQAISVTERVSDERCESSPGGDGSLVGYQVRLESARSDKTKLLFCTTGILLRKLSANKNLDGVTHVVVDEVHERSLLSDFLLIVLKDLVEKQSSRGIRKLKVVLMSATLDASLFSRYFGGCPVIRAEGRTHPVSTHFLEDVYEKLEYCLPWDSPASGTSLAPNRGKRSSGAVDNHRGKKNLVMSSWGDESLLSEDYVNPHYIPELYNSYSERTRQNLKRLNEDAIDFDLLEDLICYIDENCPPGAILVFLPGVSEIELLVDKLTALFRFGGVSSDWILPLHSSLASADQRKAFQSPPENIRKVIVATDIAETSITIDDIVYVVESGKHKENRYNPQKKMSSIVEDWISRANAKQRRGRAGRVKPGICFCLYTRHRFEKLMRPFQVPEMLRMPLTELCLQIKSLSLGDIKSFLLKVGAFEGGEELSPLGYHLAKLPVDVLIGKMMLYGAIFGCLSPVLSIAAFLSYKPPFVYPKDEKQNVEKAKQTLLNSSLDGTASNVDNKQSDHLLMVVAYNKWARILHENGSKAAQQLCRSFFLNSSVMYTIRDMRIQLGSLLADIGLVDLPKVILSAGKRKDKLDGWFADASQSFNMHAHHSSVIKSIICAGLYPNVAATIEGIDRSSLGGNKALFDSLSVKDRPLWYDGKREVHIHPSSVNHSLKSARYPFLVFLEKVETTKIFLRDTSIISPYAILLFGGSMVVQHQAASVMIDGWIKLTAPAQVAVLFKELRRTLDAVLKELIKKPETSTFVNNEVVNSIVYLLLEEEKSQA